VADVRSEFSFTTPKKKLKKKDTEKEFLLSEITYARTVISAEVSSRVFFLQMSVHPDQAQQNLPEIRQCTFSTSISFELYCPDICFSLFFVSEIAIAKLKRIKSPGSDQITAVYSSRR
jgi:hypothetical protein